MKKLIINILLRLLNRMEYKKLSATEVTDLLSRLAKDEDYERFPAYLEQCADHFRNRYLYEGEEIYKGAVIALTELRSTLNIKKEEAKKKKKKAKRIDETGGKVITY